MATNKAHVCKIAIEAVTRRVGECTAARWRMIEARTRGVANTRSYLY